jgi:hypothetical protein
MLYDRDYRILTPKEQAQLQKARDYAAKRKEYTVMQLYRFHSLMPEAGHYYESLFPNNFLHTKVLKDHEKLDLVSQQFLAVLDNDPTERAVLNFINSNHHYFLIGAILKSSYFFGHHASYAFKEFELPPNFIADYLLVGKNSGGHEFVFVELESPSGPIVNTDGTFGTSIRKGLKQIEDWDHWIDGHFGYLKLMFQKYLGTIETKIMPDEFITLDKTRIHYALVAGRRKDYKERTYRARRKLKRERNITLLHYDNLIDAVQLFKQSGNY